MPEQYGYIVFPSTHEAIRTEKLLQKHGAVFTIVPTPRSITTSCGISVRFNPSEEKIFKQLLEDYEVQTDGIYLLPKNR
ncbi:hypothetical protein Dtox_3282 [Desulfofarcimen acetoxidans DSM 771]|jgi:hypothetical protein|uniref:Putative Se/S carrier protein-like domain-containing protein n=1 Tax=Desulfofarcimen acetoxidans (strain ATCC 49208 / DSM 771 / KCTC 5769 / VKM B-1644 / 5575) TaxID=485916 RepID=C8W5L6_DESAS|nr:DUF3343 domain-containing protein [Desulfofarcimen acetoxidans]ACV64016.1 hypothetical protein Dtox_3282 [Desulfofarcimen acetoxidans DSM 771]